MTTEDPDQSQGDAAQGNFHEFDSPGLPDPGGEGELGDFSLRMLTQLGRTIENELIPRLMLAFDSTPDSRSATSVESLPELVDDFVELLIHQEANVAVRYVDTLRTKGIPLAALYLDLLAPAARRLGEMWEDDTASFADVTIGICRMHQVLLEFSRCFDATGKTSGASRNALIAPTPGEQHTFGLFMVMEFLRRDGWTCYSGSPANRREFLKLARGQDFELIGLSISADRHLDEARRLINDLKKSTSAKLVVGGRCLLENPELVTDLGADAMASDGREAVEVVKSLVESSNSGRST